MASRRNSSTVQCDCLNEYKYMIQRMARVHTWRAIADEHRIILPVIIVDLIFLQCRREDLPCRIVQADFEALQVI